ncbi:hypothetical protein IMSAGC019_00212 [Lachnospiraceae bacterium]|nr:hypothetical protein IMSAGC019_00212 [Lachnospiraceae bacterium]
MEDPIMINVRTLSSLVIAPFNILLLITVIRYQVEFSEIGEQYICLSSPSINTRAE